MSGGGGGLAVALLMHDFDEGPRSASARDVAALARGLAELGHRPTVLCCGRGPTRVSVSEGFEVISVRRLPEAPLRARGFAVPLTQAPTVLRALRRGGYDLAHAFTPVDAWVAQGSRRLGGPPVVFTATQPPRRENLADRRLRLRQVAAAFEASDAVTAADEAVRDSAREWLALDLEVAAISDPKRFEGIYRSCLGRRVVRAAAQT